MPNTHVIVSDDHRLDARDIVNECIRLGFFKKEKGWMAIVENVTISPTQEEFEVSVTTNGTQHSFHITCEYSGSCDGE